MRRLPGLLNCIDEGKVLSCAEDDAGIEIAIQSAMYKSRLARQVEPNWDDIAGMHVGSDFPGVDAALLQRCTSSCNGCCATLCL